MFEAWPSLTIALPAVISRREGWHPSPLALLSNLVGLDPSTLSADEALSALHSLQRERASLDALESQLLVRAAGAQRVSRDVLVDEACPDEISTVRRLTLVDEVVDEISAALHRSVGTVRADLETARLLHGPLRRTREALARGDVTAQHVRAIAEQAVRMRPGGSRCPADDDLFAARCAALEGRVLHHASTETPSETRQRCRRAVLSIDPEGSAGRRRQARCTRDVRAWAEDDGIGVVMARLSSPDAAWVSATVDAHARALARGGAHDLSPDAAWGEVRAAAFMELLRNPSTTTSAAAVAVEVQVLVDLETLAGVDPFGVGAVQVGSGEPADVDRDDLLALLRSTTAPVAVRRLVCDPLTGALVDQGARRYAPGSALVDWLQSRDQNCRFPGCRRRAWRCDVDHAVDFARGGRTTVANTGLLCRRHHNLKTHGGWTIEGSAFDGSCTFVSPTGHRYHHKPVPLARTDPADPDPGDPDPGDPDPRPRARPAPEPDDPPF